MPPPSSPGPASDAIAPSNMTNKPSLNLFPEPTKLNSRRIRVRRLASRPVATSNMNLNLRGARRARLGR